MTLRELKEALEALPTYLLDKEAVVLDRPRDGEYSIRDVSSFRPDQPGPWSVTQVEIAIVGVSE